MKKYPRTHHLRGSRLQPGDEDMHSVAFSEIEGRFLVIEEKLDGANSGISFDENGQLLLQSRGHYLTGGPREKHFNLFKQWANCHQLALWEALSTRYVLYGEWLFAKHTIFYDQLPHYFLEFDLFDRETETFLSTEKRRELLRGAPILSVPVLHEGTVQSLEELTEMVGHSLYKSEQWKKRLREVAESANLDPEKIFNETDLSNHMEGLYIKVEEDGQVVDRLKWVRASFLTAVVDSGTHWLHRPIVPNQLAEGVDLFGGAS